ncbi:hypothetical protein NSK_006002 [Nannochloropsis salina CCMP1776]|uniref:Guanylate kinase-like domain-containing protein n=1 Tax=Nannochloropsis salina CCMP1776 TaxID=1027361 RepID=A0A4D9CUJ6_9STRA|nr:hypothetical protein NSK_006002 [Nannochloropsis salina CCMP1776]|eukprot:TFJ82576.1 hypothetical protein NSK_006002 [Nannochloropsis salina CCMP1776]
MVTSTSTDRLGDVVLFPGKWVGDTGIGQIRFLQLTGDGRGGKEWIADLTPFKDVGEDLYRAEKGTRARTFPVSALQPLSHFYIGSSDAFKVPHKEEAGGEGMGRRREPVRMAPGYRTEGFSLAPAKVDAEAMAAARGKYQDLKRRILTDTAAFGGLATVAVGLNAGVEDAGIFLAGVAGSVLYLVLLTQRADAMGQAGGEGGGLSKAGGGKPVHGGGGGGAGLAGGRLFNYVPQDEFWSATLGFLSYRVPMLGREVGEMLARRSEGQRGQAGTLGGSVRAGMALVDRLQGGREGGREGETAAAEAAGGAYRNEVTVLVVSGPEGMGKRGLARRLVESDPLQRYAEPVWVTTRAPKEGEVDGRDYHFVEDFAFQVMREQGRFLTAYQEEAGEGRAWFGLRPSDVVDVMRKEGKVSVLALDAFAADKLLALGEARLIGVWVTLNTVDQLRGRYGGEEGGKEEEVEAAVSRATVAIEHALMGEAGRRGFYEHTIYDDKGKEETLRSLRDFADFALSL